MKIPGPETDGLPGAGEAYIPNAYEGHSRLTRREAIDCINYLSGAMLADERIRSGQ